MKAVAIVGSHPETRSLAPFDNPAVDIWTFNEAPNQNWVKRWDVNFQLHVPTVYRNPMNRTDPQHWEWLQRKHGKPIYMQKRDPLVPDSVEYPLEAICRMFIPHLTAATGNGLKHLQYFTSTIAFSVALALYKGYQRIMLYGVEMASATEYVYQRDCVAFWMGVASGRGVRVELHSGVQIFDQPRYGYDGDLTYKPEQFAERAKQARSGIAAAETAAKLAEQQLALADPRNHDELQAAMKKRFDTLAALAGMKGAAEQCDIYEKKCSEMIAATGQALVSRQEFEFNAAQAQQEMQKISTQIGRLDGQLDYFHRAFVATGEMRAMEQFAVGAQKQHEYASEIGRLRGIADENLYWLKYADGRYKAAGGEKSVAAFEAVNEPFAAERAGLF